MSDSDRHAAVDFLHLVNDQWFGRAAFAHRSDLDMRTPSLAADGVEARLQRTLRRNSEGKERSRREATNVALLYQASCERCIYASVAAYFHTRFEHRGFTS